MRHTAALVPRQCHNHFYTPSCFLCRMNIVY
jgi:hypothetical protein